MPKHSRRIAVTAVAMGMFLLSASWIAAAENTRQTARFPVLRTIMRDMGQNMQVIADAVAREDWTLVARTAPLLAARPQPSMAEKIRLVGFLGPDAGAFRGYDKSTRQAAQELERAASRGDGEAAAAAFATLERSCLACHRDFRQSFVDTFDEKP